VRWAAIAVSLLIGALPAYFFVRIVTPPPLPSIADQSDENYRELVDLAKAMYERSRADPNEWLGTNAQYTALLARDEREWQRLLALIDEGCQFPWQRMGPIDDVFEALNFLSYVTSIRCVRGDGTASAAPKAEACLAAIRLAHLESRSTHISGGAMLIYASDSSSELWNLRFMLSAPQCKELALALWQVEAEREPWEDVAVRSRLIQLNSGLWGDRRNAISIEFTGAWHVRDMIDRWWALPNRMLIVELALQAHQLETGQLPESLAELVPDYLPAVPDDPMGDGPLSYRRDGGTYTLYGVGPNGIDDGGQTMSAPANLWQLDVTPAVLYSPPQRLPPTASPGGGGTSGESGGNED
jgi:hypothetical protein